MSRSGGFYVAREDKHFPTAFNFPGVLSCFYMVWADGLAHPVNSHEECVRTIKKDHQKSVAGFNLHLFQIKICEF